MKRLILSTATASILIVFSGCASKYFVNYRANPQDNNVELYCDWGKGYELDGFRYPHLQTMTNEAKESKILPITNCKAVFGNSYTKFYPTTVDLNKYPDGVTVTVSAERFIVKYDSLPRGASIVCGNNVLGKTPNKVVYYTDDGRKKILINKCKAIWKNGLSREYPDRLSKNETSFLVQLPAGKDYESIQTNYEKDLQNRNSANIQRKMEQNRLSEQQRHNKRIEAQENSRQTQQALDNLNKQLRDMTPKTYNVNVHHY
ncbi:hypothetical protein [Sulfurimonas sp.]